jgi:hypothetical protein
MFWQSKRSKEVLNALKWLNHGNRNLPDDQRFWTIEERSTKEWDAHYHDLLKLIEAWKEEEETSAADYYFMVTHTYESLAALVPPGPAREDAMSNFLSFVEQRYATLENHNLWFVRRAPHCSGPILQRTRRTRRGSSTEWREAGTR